MKATLALTLFTLVGCAEGQSSSSLWPPAPDTTDSGTITIGTEGQTQQDAGAATVFVDAGPQTTDSVVAADTYVLPMPPDATATEDGTGLPNLQPGVICAGDTDCITGETCDMACGQGSGLCREIPTNCFGAPKMQEECGCDGVTYFNGCHRLMAGAGIAHLGECDIEAPETQICGDNLSCPNGTSCTRRVADSSKCSLAPLMTNGTCWVLPQNCVPSIGPFYRPCGTGSCESFCSIAKTTTQIYSCP